MSNQPTDILGRGWKFPISVEAGRLPPLLGGDSKIRQSIEIILSTAPGERQMRPDFGCGIHELVFQPNTFSLRGLVQEKVRESLLRWEPRIDLLDVRVESPSDEGNLLLIRIDYRVRTNNALNNLVYPFFLQEGTP